MLAGAVLQEQNLEVAGNELRAYREERLFGSGRKNLAKST